MQHTVVIIHSHNPAEQSEVRRWLCAVQNRIVGTRELDEEDVQSMRSLYRLPYHAHMRRGDDEHSLQRIQVAA